MKKWKAAMILRRLYTDKVKCYLQIISRYKFAILMVYFLAVIVYMLLPVFNGGSLCTTDFASNLMRARLMRENIVQDLALDGWSYKQYLGFQPFLFYFPGFFMLINFIHFLSFGLISIMLAYKLLILASFLILPLSVYYCMRTFGFLKVHSFFAAVFSLGSGVIYGYGFKNLTLWGMDVQFFVVSLLPAILALYHRFVRREEFQFQRSLLLSLLFALIAVTHLQTTLYFLIVIIIYNLYAIVHLKRKWLYIRKNLVLLLVTGLLVVFWYYPILRYYDYMRTLTSCESESLSNRLFSFLR